MNGRNTPRLETLLQGVVLTMALVIPVLAAHSEFEAEEMAAKARRRIAEIDEADAVESQQPWSPMKS